MTQEGQSSIGLQILSGLTLFLIPYTVNTEYVVEYTLRHVQTGCTFSHNQEADFHTLVGWVVAPFVFVSQNGVRETMNNLANALYAGLADTGAFEESIECRRD